MKKGITILSVLISLSCFSQESFRDKLFFGGNATVSISTQATILGAAPLVGYRITDKWSAGIGVSYYYFRYNYAFINYSSSQYGGNLFTRFLVTDKLMLLSEFHLINTTAYQVNINSGELGSTRVNVPIFYVGGGYRYPVGESTFVSLSVLYDLIGDINSPYSNPIMRGGIVFGF